MEQDIGIGDAAQLFKVLGNESRLHLIHLISEQPRTVGELAEATGLTQPLASQHLRTLRQAGLVAPTREGKAVRYGLTDEHVAHIVTDALVHVREDHHHATS